MAVPLRARAYEAESETSFARDVVAGLTSRPKWLSPKYFYDAAGAQLFEAITLLPEYYPTRTELAILRRHAADIVRRIPPGAALVEFGSGSSAKARTLLAAAPSVAAYVPVDISSEMLAQEADKVRQEFPGPTVLPVAADFTQPFQLPPPVAAMPRTGFFPGSTIGNFEPHEASSFLRHARQILGRGATLIIGVDLVKDPAILNAAYNDLAGVTAKFNLNLLTRINRELNANFDLSAFCHRAFYNSARNRIEMHLASKRRQKVRVAGRMIEFRTGETIHTENSYKYTLESFGALARGSGWNPSAVWMDDDRYFSVQALVVQDD